MTQRLLIVTSHPIQYQVPWFRALHEDGQIDLKVLFLSLPGSHQQGVGFGHAFEWDVPLLDGYEWQLAPSAAGSIGDGWWGLRIRSAAADIAAQRPDVVLVTGWHNRGMLQCLLAVSKLRLPLLLRGESNGLAPLSLFRRLKSHWIAAHATRLLPIGQANRRFYEAIGPGLRLGPEVAYCVDNRFFSERCEGFKARRPQLREQFDVPSEAICFLFVGKFVDKKRPADLLGAIERIGQQGDRRVHLLLVGTGPLEEELRVRVSRNELPVSFAGFLNQTEISAAYAIADCLVLPSDYGETWGLVVNEAMACGIPAIVSDRVGCGPDLVHDAVTGFRFPFGDIERLADVMRSFMALSGEQRREMGGQAQQLVLQKYSIDAAVHGTIEAVLQVSDAP